MEANDCGRFSSLKGSASEPSVKPYARVHGKASLRWLQLSFDYTEASNGLEYISSLQCEDSRSGMISIFEQQAKVSLA